MLFWKLSLILRTFGNAPLRIDHGRAQGALRGVEHGHTYE